MDRKLAEEIVAVCGLMMDECNTSLIYEEVVFELIENYFDKGMYGQTTTAILTHDPLFLMQAILVYAENFSEDGEAKYPVQALAGFRMDSLDHDYVVY